MSRYGSETGERVISFEFDSSLSAYASDPSFQEQLMQHFAEQEAILKSLRDAVECGYAYRKTSELLQQDVSNESSKRWESGYEVLNRLPKQLVCRGILEFVSGNESSAVRNFDLIWSLGSRFQGAGWYEESMGVNAMESACKCYTKLLLMKPEEKFLRQTLAALRDSRKRDIDYTGAASTQWNLSYIYSSLKRTEIRSTSKFRNYKLFDLLERYLIDPDCITQVENKQWLDDMVKRIALCVDIEDSYFSASLILSLYSWEVTFNPTVRRRLAGLVATEPLFDDVYWVFERKDFKDLPPEYLIDDYRFDSWSQRHGAATIEAHIKRDALALAYGANLYKLRNGVYPLSVDVLFFDEYVEHLKDSRDEWKIIEVRDVLSASDHLQMMAEDIRERLRFDFLWDDRKRPTFSIPSDECALFEVKSIRATPGEIRDALLSYGPLVREATLDYAANVKPIRHMADTDWSTDDYREDHLIGIAIEVALPAKYWWVYNYGPDGVDDGGYPPYDPTNGVVSKGDIGQFVGYEF